MKIIKKYIDILGVAHIFLDDNGVLNKVLLNYDNHNIYEVWVYVALTPHKRIKRWHKLQEYRCDIRSYDTIKEMIITKTEQANEVYGESNKDYLARLKKWQEFIKNT